VSNAFLPFIAVFLIAAAVVVAARDAYQHGRRDARRELASPPPAPAAAPRTP
jgi:hypothetical protein